MRGTDYNTRRHIQGLGQISHTSSRHGADHDHIHTHRRKTCLQTRFQQVTTHTRVFSNQHPWPLPITLVPGQYGAGSLSQARKEALRCDANVFLVDLGLPDGRGEEVLRLLARHQPDAELLVFTVFGDESRLIEALQMGANIVRYAFSARVRYLVVATGPARPGQWMTIERPVAEDFLRAFGGLLYLSGAVIMTINVWQTILGRTRDEEELNSAPYDAWIFKMKTGASIDGLLDAKAYEANVAASN